MAHVHALAGLRIVELALEMQEGPIRALGYPLISATVATRTLHQFARGLPTLTVSTVLRTIKRSEAASARMCTGLCVGTMVGHTQAAVRQAAKVYR